MMVVLFWNSFEKKVQLQIILFCQFSAQVEKGWQTFGGGGGGGIIIEIEIVTRAIWMSLTFELFSALDNDDTQIKNNL